MYIGDSFNNRIRKVTVSTGIISTIAGTGSIGSTSGSYSGDGGQATAATFHFPLEVAVDSSGNTLLLLLLLLLLLSSLLLL